MAIQMIFCVETNRRADTDSIYIQETISHWYTVSRKVKISKIYMNSKTKYNAKEVVREIARMSKEFVLGETKVIYCIDTDQYERDAARAAELDEISRYCKDKGYDLIWFCHDVEEVFQGKKISDSLKVQEASKFRRKKMIAEIQEARLSCDEKYSCSSNILNVLDKYLLRKQ